jgi:wobble nucleotide-excising tRNase
MLERIEYIQGIGLLHDANGKPFTWKKATFIYGDNGRGKSTLATVLRSSATGDASFISARATVDGTKAPAALLQFENGHKVSFTAGKWSEARSELLVFDSDFIEKNVYSGGVVSTGHRKNLLEFALGEKAVAAQRGEDHATTHAKQASGTVQQLTQQLTGHHVGMGLAQFEALASAADADEQIDALQRRILSANSSASIARKAVPVAVSLPNLDAGAVFNVLRTAIENVQDDAEAVVRTHVSKLRVPGAEAWLSQGTRYDDGQTCPYCAQSTEDVDLIRAYRTHFNAAYAALKEKVGRLEATVVSTTAPSVIDSFAQGLATANATVAAWEEHLPVVPAIFDHATAAEKLQDIQGQLVELVRRKQADPTGAVGTADEQAGIEKLWAEIRQAMQTANESLKKVSDDINAFRQRLAQEDVRLLQGQIERLQLAKRRHTPAVQALIGQLATARTASTQADERKRLARENLDSVMKQTLVEYEQAINTLLKKFGASFAIEKMDANFRGSAPRSEYGLALRGKSVPLEGGPPSFSTTMSEGDKRTLAFAFFVASAQADPKLKDRVVVIDDPMCSLDLNRKRQTHTVLKEIYAKAGQTVVLAHDPYFVRDVRDAILAKDSTAPVAIFQLQHTVHGYTDFGKIDVDRECESPYYKHHRLLSDFVTTGNGDHAHVAKSIRLLLEGYLHRRFPGLLPQGLMLGQSVGHIVAAKPTEPLAFAQGLVPEINEINDYAGSVPSRYESR